MLKQLKKLIVLNKADFYLCIGLIGGIFLLTQIIIGVVMAVAKPDEGVRVSAFILVLAAFFMMLGVTSANIMTTYLHSIQFGCTRRRGLALTMELVGVEYLVTIAVVVIGALIEDRLCPDLWKALAGRSMELEFFLDGIRPPWWVIPAAPAAGAALGLIAAAIIQRFGRVGGWFLWGLWMVICVGQSFLPWEEHWFSSPWLLPLGIALGLAAVLWSVWSLLHASIKA